MWLCELEILKRVRELFWWLLFVIICLRTLPETLRTFQTHITITPAAFHSVRKLLVLEEHFTIWSVAFAGALEGRIVWGLNTKPRSLASARGNIMAALGHLGMLTAQTCPRGLVFEVEHILQVRVSLVHVLCHC